MEPHLPFATIGFIGAGNMAEAILVGLIEKGLFAASAIRVSDIQPERQAALASAHGVLPVPDNAALFSESDIVVLSVKPQQIETVLKALTARPDVGVSRRKLVISIAAGCPMEKIERLLYPRWDESTARNLPIVRVMPNTPALVGKGVSGICANRHATDPDLAAAERIFSSVGRVLFFEESQLDAVTALSGSGPAYVFYLAEAMIDAGLRMGFTSGAAVSLTVGTLAGAAALLESQGLPPEELRRRVTSPGGTTEAAVQVFGARAVGEGIVAGILAAAQRAKELR